MNQDKRIGKPDSIAKAFWKSPPLSLSQIVAMKPLPLVKKHLGQHLPQELTKCQHSPCTGTTFSDLKQRDAKGIGWHCNTCKKLKYPWNDHLVLHVQFIGATFPIQMGIWYMAVWRYPIKFVPLTIAGSTANMALTIYNAWKDVLVTYCKEKQKEISYGSPEGQPPQQFESDEFVYGTHDKGTAQAGEKVKFVEVVGTKVRGDRETLHLKKRSLDRCTTTRAENGRACPTKLTSQEWEALRDRRGSTGMPLAGPNSLNNSDGADCYNHTKHELHDSVCHSTRNGGPEFTKTKYHDVACADPESPDKLSTLGGTQVMDGLAGHFKHDARCIPRGKTTAMRRQLRESQWHHWHLGNNMWDEAGKVMRVMRGL